MDINRQSDPFLMGSTKMLWHMDRVLAWQKGERIAPLLIDIGATQICQASCVWCYAVWQKMDHKSILREDILVRLFSEAPLIGVKAITLTGNGEPALNPGVWKAMQEGKRHGLDIGVASNTIGIDTSDKVNAVVDNCLWLRTTIGGYDKESYKKIHKVDFFEKVLNNVRAIIAAKKARNSNITLGFQMVLVPECLEYVRPLAQLSLDLGLDYFVIKQFSNPANSGIPSSTGYDQDKFFEDSQIALKEAEAMSNDKTKIIVKWNLMKQLNKRMYPYCIDLPFIFQISGSGKCYPCGFLFNREEYCYGDLYKQTLPEIIKSEHYWNVINKIKNTPTSELCAQGCCRHDMVNLWLTNYLNVPQHKNHI